MASRIDLQGILETILGTRNVYFQPPASVKLKYPCIIYERSNITSDFADDKRYKGCVRYILTYIDANPDSSVPFDLLSLQYCSYDRHFVSDNLHHDAFILYY